MKLCFVFLPPVSPSYLPLGISILAAYARTFPGIEVSARDLNQSGWKKLAQQHPDIEIMRQGVRDKTLFYQQDVYQGFQQPWKHGWALLKSLQESAAHYLDFDAATPELECWLDEWEEELRYEDADWLGFSVMYLDQMPLTLALAKRIRKNRPSSTTKVMLGGATMTALHAKDLALYADFLDVIVTGEGEAAIRALCEGKPVREWPGAIYRDGSGVTCLPPRDAPDINSLPFPDFSLLNPKECFCPTPVLPLLASRGCSWRACRFCAHNSSFGKHRKKTLERMTFELRHLGEHYGTDHVYFSDQYLNANDLEMVSRAIELSGFHFRYHAMSRPDPDFDPQRLARFAENGCRWISWGVESGSQRLLDIARKGSKVEVIKRVLEDSKSARIANLAMMIYGLPTSTDTDLEETLDFLDQIYDSLDVLTASKFTLFEDTPFSRHPDRFQLVVGNPQSLLRINGRKISSTRLQFFEHAEDGSTRPSRGQLEIDEWERRKRWMPELEASRWLCVEHSLLQFSHRFDTLRPGTTPPRYPVCEPA